MIGRVRLGCRGGAAVLAVAALFPGAAAAAAGQLPLALVHDVPLPGRPTRFDYQWVDPAGGRLYIAHLGDDSIDVVDLRSEKVVGVVGGLPRVHGVLAVPERHLVLATVTGDE